MDFDDLILLVVRLFQANPAILEKWQHRIRYMLVDEYQDTNLCQYEMVKLLVAARSMFTVVGMMTSPFMPGVVRDRKIW